MELLVIVTRSSAPPQPRASHAVLPYYGSGRQDRKVQGRIRSPRSLVARPADPRRTQRLLGVVPASAGQKIHGVLRHPVDHLFAAPPVSRPPRTKDLVEPRARLARRGAPWLRAGARRTAQGGTGRHRQAAMTATTSPMFMSYGDVKDTDVVSIIDMIDAAGTLIQAVDARARGANRHPQPRRAAAFALRPGDPRVEESVLEEVIIADTVPARTRAAVPRLHFLGRPAARGTMHHIHDEESVSTLLPYAEQDVMFRRVME